MLTTSQGRRNLRSLRAAVWAISVRIPIFAVVVILAIAMFDVVKVYSARPDVVLPHVAILKSARDALDGFPHN